MKPKTHSKHLMFVHVPHSFSICHYKSKCGKTFYFVKEETLIQMENAVGCATFSIYMKAYCFKIIEEAFFNDKYYRMLVMYLENYFLKN